MLYAPNCCQVRQAVELAWHPGNTSSMSCTHIYLHVNVYITDKNIAVITRLFWHILEHIRDLSQWADPAGRGMAA